VGRVHGESCGRWGRGQDCKFNEWWYWFVVMLLWLLTAMPFLSMTLSRRVRSLSGPTGICLLLTACSALLNSLDALLFLIYGMRDKRSDEYGSGTLSSLGSILLMFALRLFAYLWCDICGALSRLEKEWNVAAAWRFTVIRRGYDIAAFGHIPFALLMSCSDYEWGPDFDYSVFIYMIWCGASLFLGLTVLALAMWCIARSITGTRARNLVQVTAINLGEQMLYDVVLLLCGFIFRSQSYLEFGLLQAVVHILMFLLSWLLHAQVFMFFYICDANDPFSSQEDLDVLLHESAAPNPWSELELETTVGAACSAI